MSIENVTSPQWENIFDNSPIEFNDTEEYEYTEYLESGSGGADISNNQTIFRLYNRDVDPYLLFHKGFITVRGFLSLTNGGFGAGDSNNFYGANTDKAALCNLGNFKMFSKAELKIESTMIQKVDDPGHIALVRLLTSLCNDNLDSQGGLFFFHKDTGTTGAPNVYKYAHLNAASNAGVVDFSTTTNAGTSKGIQIYDNPVFNEGFLKRWKLCRNQAGNVAKTVEMVIPLAYLFDFYNKCQFPFRGQRHEVTLYKNANINDYIVRTGEAAEHIFNLKKITMWVPRLKPSLQRLAELDAKLASGATQTLAWSDCDYYKSPEVANGVLTTNWRVTAMQSRPSKIYVFFQSSARANGDQTFNKMIFDTMDLRTLEVRVNGHIFPKETLTLIQGATAEPDYMRAYLMLLESQNKMLVDDTGMLISYKEFNEIYNLLVFDLTKMERRVYESISASEIEIRYTLRSSFAHHGFCIIESDKRATLQGSNNKMLITL
jgi:hypothetical protein